MANERDRGSEGLLTLVCVTCGRERFFEEQPPEHLVCDRCGSTVFRSFLTPTRADDATIAQLEESSRSVALDEESPDTAPGDVRDLNNP